MSKNQHFIRRFSICFLFLLFVLFATGCKTCHCPSYSTIRFLKNMFYNISVPKTGMNKVIGTE